MQHEEYHKDEVGGLFNTQFMHLLLYRYVVVHNASVYASIYCFYGCDLLAMLPEEMQVL